MAVTRGYKGKYFSLAAILAMSTTVVLGAQVQSIVDTQKQLQTPKEKAEAAEAEVLEENDAPVVVISKKVQAKKSKIYSASKQLVSATNVTDNVEIITSEEIELQGMHTVADALNTLSGISLTSYGGTGQSTQLYLQGMSNKYTLILVDGVRFNDPFNTSGAEIGHMMLDNVEKIEVIKGAQSGVWGADAAAGVVNIITKKAKQGTHYTLGTEIGSYDYRRVNASLTHRTQAFDLAVSLLRTTEEGFSALATKGEDLDQYEDDGYRNTTVNLNGGYWLDGNNRVEFGYYDINSLVQFDGYDPLTYAPDPDSYKATEYESKSGYLKYKHFYMRHTLEATLSKSYFHNHHLGLVFDPWSPEVEDSVGTVPAIELKDTIRYGQDNLLVVGTGYEKRKIDYTVVGGTEESEQGNNKTLFANNTYRYENFVLSQALRWDKYNRYGSKVTGKLGIKYLLSDDVYLYANYGTAYKAPNIMDMINIWGSSNFDIKPENVKSYNGGIVYKGLEVNAFRHEIKDMIAPDPTIIWPAPGRNINIDGTSVLKGLEINYEKMVSKTLLIGGNYTYIDAKDANGNRLKRRPRYQVGMNMAYLPNKEWKVSLDGAYIGSRLDIHNVTYANTETGRYFVANAKVDYAINQTWNAYLKVTNLLDREYQTVHGYATAERSYYLGVQAKF